VRLVDRAAALSAATGLLEHYQQRLSMFLFSAVVVARAVVTLQMAAQAMAGLVVAELVAVGQVAQHKTVQQIAAAAVAVKVQRPGQTQQAPAAAASSFSTSHKETKWHTLRV
jgi:hypothetical protein